MIRLLFVAIILLLPACSTTVAVLDVTASTAIYAGKTVVNTIDMITPDIVECLIEDKPINMLSMLITPDNVECLFKNKSTIQSAKDVATLF